MPTKIFDEFTNLPISRAMKSLKRKERDIKPLLKSKTRKKSELFAAEELQPLVDWCEHNEKPYAQIQAKFAEMTGEHILVPELRRWLEPKLKERVQCRFGVGLVLVKVYEALTGKASV